MHAAVNRLPGGPSGTSSVAEEDMDIYSEMSNSAHATMLSVETLLQQSSAYVEKVTQAAKQQQLALEPEALHFPLDCLTELDEAFGSMLIDLSADNEALDSVEEELRWQDDAHSLEQRQSSFEIARIHGSQWLDRLTLSFKQFKADQMYRARKLWQGIKDDLHYDMHKQKLVDKRAGATSVEAELVRKRALLAEKQKDQFLSAEELRYKYESDFLKLKLQAVLDDMARHQRLLQLEEQRCEAADAEVQTTRLRLAEMLHEMQRAADMQAAKFRKKQIVIGLSDDGLVQYDTEMKTAAEEGEVSPALKEERLRRDVAGLEMLLKQNAEMSESCLETEKSCIKLRSAIDRLMHSDGYSAFERLRLHAGTLEQQLTADKEREQEIKEILEREFGVEDIDSQEGQERVQILLDARRAKEAAKKQRQVAEIEAAILRRGTKVADDRALPLQRAVRTMGEASLAISKRTVETLRAAASQKESEIYSVQERQIQSVFDSTGAAETMQGGSRDSRKTPTGFAGALSASLGFGVVDDLLQDYGLQAAAEHLAVLDNLLADGSKRQIAKVRAASHHGDVEAMKAHMIDVVKGIASGFAKMRAQQRAMKNLEPNLATAKAELDGLRAAFLAKIGGRRNYPKTLDGRRAELEFLGRRLPDMRAENDVLRASIALKKAKQEPGSRFKARVITVTSMAAAPRSGSDVVKPSALAAANSHAGPRVASLPAGISRALHTISSLGELSEGSSASSEQDEQEQEQEQEKGLGGVGDADQCALPIAVNHAIAGTEVPISALQSKPSIISAHIGISPAPSKMQPAIPPSFSSAPIAVAVVATTDMDQPLASLASELAITGFTNSGKEEPVMPTRQRPSSKVGDLLPPTSVGADEKVVASIRPPVWMEKGWADMQPVVSSAAYSPEVSDSSARMLTNGKKLKEKEKEKEQAKGLLPIGRVPLRLHHSFLDIYLERNNDPGKEITSSRSLLSAMSSGSRDADEEAPTLDLDVEGSTALRLEGAGASRPSLAVPPVDNDARKRLPLSVVDLPDKSAEVLVPVKALLPFKREPFRLQLTPAYRNLHFGGHRLRSEDLLSQELLMQLPEMYSHLSGKNERHWSVPALPGNPRPSNLQSARAELRKARRRSERRINKLLRAQELREHEERLQRLARQVESTFQIRSSANKGLPDDERELGIFEDDGNSDDSDDDEVVGNYSSDALSMLPSFIRQMQYTQNNSPWHQEQSSSPTAVVEAMMQVVDKFQLRLHPSFVNTGNEHGETGKYN